MQTVTIRQAQEKDLSRIMDLVLAVLSDMELDIFNHEPKVVIKEWLIEASKKKGYRYNYERAVVAVNKRSEIMGVAYSYPASDEPLIDEAWDEVMEQHRKHYELFTEPETYKDEWYLDTLFVDPKFRRKGVATQLIRAVSQEAKKANVPIVGLNVDLNNTRASTLYEQIGFIDFGRLTLTGGHKYRHMQWRY